MLMNAIKASICSSDKYPNEGIKVLYSLESFCAVVSPESITCFGFLMKFFIHSTVCCDVIPANCGPIPSWSKLWQLLHLLAKEFLPSAIVAESVRIELLPECFLELQE